MNITIYDIIFVFFIIILCSIWYNIIKTKIKLEKTEKMFELEKIVPEGADISHGMVLIENIELVEDKKPTLSWISKLSK